MRTWRAGKGRGATAHKETDEVRGRDLPEMVNPQILERGKLCPPLKCSTILSLCRDSVRP